MAERACSTLPAGHRNIQNSQWKLSPGRVLAVHGHGKGTLISANHTHPSNGPLSGNTQVSRYQKGKTKLDFSEAKTVSGSGISWAICKSAPRSRQITMPAPHCLVSTGRMPFLPPNQQRQSTEGTIISANHHNNYGYIYLRDTIRRFTVT